MSNTGYRERMMSVLRHIGEHMDEPLSLEDLAAVACFSPYHFHRIFRGMMGESVMGYIRRLRLERAALRLSHGRRSVLDIAMEAGFESNEAFTRAFRSRFDMSPTAYRRQAAAHRSSGRAEYHPIPLIPHTQGGKHMEISIKHFDSIRVACVRHVGPYAGCEAAWASLCAWAGPKGLLGPDTQTLGVCHDDPQVTDSEKIRYDACITVGPDVMGEDVVEITDLMAGEYAVTLHEGPYETLHRTYDQLCGGWAPESGREIAHGPSVEVYLNDPQNTPPEQLLTEIRVPLEAM